MKKKHVIILILVDIFAIAIMLALTAQSGSAAEIEQDLTQAKQESPIAHLRLDSAYIDMGIIPRDSIGEAYMGFTNTGDAPLQILRIFSECGCTVPSYSSDEVLPGEQGEIKIRFNGKNRQPGSFRKALRIRSNADNPRELLIVKGRIK